MGQLDLPTLRTIQAPTRVIVTVGAQRVVGRVPLPMEELPIRESTTVDSVTVTATFADHPSASGTLSRTEIGMAGSTPVGRCSSSPVLGRLRLWLAASRRDNRKVRVGRL